MKKCFKGFFDNYKAPVFIFFLLITSISSEAQKYLEPAVAASADRRRRVDSTSLMPTGCGVPWALSAVDIAQKHAAQYYDSCNKRYYLYDPKLNAWDTLHIGASGSGGGTNIYNSDGSLTGNRTLTLDGYQLNITGTGSQDGSNFKSGDILLSMGDANSHGFNQLSKTPNGSAYWQSLVETGQTSPITIETEAISDTVNNTGTWHTHVGKAGSYNSHLDVNQDGIYLKTGASSATEQLGILSTGGIRLPATVDSTTGVIFKGSDRFIHSYQNPSTSTTLGTSLYIGRKSGNFSFTGASGGFGGRNLAIGDSTLFANTTGYRNIAIGVWNSAANTTGFENTSVGASALRKNIDGYDNTVVGAISMEQNTTGWRNSTLGFSTLQYNTTGTRNTAIGGRAIQNNTTGFANVGVGFDALYGNIVGDHNVGVGLDALYWSDGTHNTAIGDSTLWGLYALGTKHMGYKNTVIGSRAGYHLGDTYPNFASIFDTAITLLGANASRDSSIPYTTSLQNMTVIGYDARGFASNQVVLGNNNVTSTLLKGAINMRGYGAGANTGTATYALQVDANGDVIEGAVGGGISGLTTNELVYGNSATTIASLPVATYPSLTELSYVKGVTSAIQTQMDGKISASSTNTLTNKRWTARVGSTTSSGTPTINTDDYDIYKLTAQAADITSFTTNLSGTPNDGDILEIQITGTAARAITWGASFVSSTVTLPTTTVTTATLTVILQWFTTSSYGNNKWVCVNSF